MAFVLRDGPADEHELEQRAGRKDQGLRQTLAAAFQPPLHPEERRQKGAGHAAQAGQAQNHPLAEAVGAPARFRDEDDAAGRAEHVLGLNGVEIDFGIGRGDQQQQERAPLAQRRGQAGDGREQYRRGGNKLDEQAESGGEARRGFERNVRGQEGADIGDEVEVAVLRGGQRVQERMVPGIGEITGGFLSPESAQNEHPGRANDQHKGIQDQGGQFVPPTDRPVPRALPHRRPGGAGTGHGHQCLINAGGAKMTRGLCHSLLPSR